MPKLTDLTGREIAGGYRVVDQADFVKRVAHWNIAHTCGAATVLPHTMLTQALAGKLSHLPACPECEPIAEPGIDLGMHQGPGDPPHQVGTPCAKDDGCTRCQLTPCECAAIFAPGAFLTTAAPGVETFTHEAGWVIPMTDAYTPEPTDTATGADVRGELHDAGTGAVAVYGKAEALLEAQEHLCVIRTAVTQPAKDANGHAGMSALGGCERKLGWRLAYGKPAAMAWRPWVGTAAHGNRTIGLEKAYQDDNARALGDTPRPPRWLTDVRVEAGGERGKVDVYDSLLFEVVDWKVPGITAVRRVVKGHVSSQYNVQLDLYALGLNLAGYRVDTVALLALPAAGELEDAAWYSRPADLDNARAALARRDRINAMLEVAEPDRVLGALAVEADSCEYCPVFKAGRCPGVDVKEAKAPAVAWDASSVALPPGIATTNLEEK